MPTEHDQWAAEYAAAEKNLVLPARPGSLKLVKEPEWLSTTPPAEHLVPKSFRNKGLEPAATFTYTDRAGVPIGYVCRYEPEGSRKTFLPWTYGRLDGESEDRWATRGFSRPLPVYNLHEAVEQGGRQLIIVEGEGKVEALRTVMKSPVAVSWPQGAQSIPFVNWTPLKERERLEVFILPDHDEVGRNAALKIAAKMAALGYLVKMVEVPIDKPEHWDIKDAILLEGWGRNEVVAFLRDNWYAYNPPEEPAPEDIEDVLPPAPDAPPSAMAEEVEVMTRSMGLEVDERRLQLHDWMGMGLDVQNGKPAANVSNVSMLLMRMRIGEVWYDTFLNRRRTLNAERTEARDWTDADDIRWTIDMQRRGGVTKANKEIVSQAIYELAYRDLRNELQDWIQALPAWDQVKRIDHFFTDVAGSKDSAYTRSASRNFFISLVARAMKPGCKVDTMVVLEGPQGAFKSTLLEIIGGKWYTIMRHAPDSNDFAIVLAGKWVIEIAELDAFSKSDVRAVKRALRTPTDRYRSPYGRVAEDHPRSSVFAGSTNRDDYNMDDTGFRHGWPISCGDIRLDLARTHREQYFAEALADYSAAATWWEMPGDETSREQLSRYVGDPWTLEVLDAVRQHTSVTLDWVLAEIKLDISKKDRAAQMRVAGILKLAGWKKSVEWDGKTVRRWARG